MTTPMTEQGLSRRDALVAMVAGGLAATALPLLSAPAEAQPAPVGLSEPTPAKPFLLSF